MGGSRRSNLVSGQGSPIPLDSPLQYDPILLSSAKNVCPSLATRFTEPHESELTRDRGSSYLHGAPIAQQPTIGLIGQLRRIPPVDLERGCRSLRPSIRERTGMCHRRWSVLVFSIDASSCEKLNAWRSPTRLSRNDAVSEGLACAWRSIAGAERQTSCEEGASPHDPKLASLAMSASGSFAERRHLTKDCSKRPPRGSTTSRHWQIGPELPSLLVAPGVTRGPAFVVARSVATRQSMA